jgi:site-specific DNA-methyltransferase (adenine-specific)
MFSSQTDQWATPQDFFDKLNEEFHFTLDPCADEFNHKCEKYFTKKMMDFHKNGMVKRFFVIPHMARKLQSGSKSALQKYIAVNVFVP